MERRQKVRVLVDEMRRYDANPTRLQCLTVIRKIIRQYPKTFADMTADGSLLGCGYTSLLIQVKNRIENVNRGGVYAHHRASRSSSTYKRGPTDTYGCTTFLPKLPPEETNETVEQNRQRLVEIYRQEGAGGVERAEVSATAADVETTLTLPASPRLILLGGTGQVTTGRRWMITLEGRVIFEGITQTFLTGLAAVFAIYYVFNLQYQEEAACTLEFIQRRFIGINPERGTKAIRGKDVSKKTGVIVQKKSATVNTHVSTLLKNLLDYEWDFI
ncbi:hypothetical protein NQZ68_008285 [Dissostichus eleginoides]|nr:hypothetical protein NQZ68_008285 [Dissostichus eleginoides]